MLESRWLAIMARDSSLFRFHFVAAVALLVVGSLGVPRPVQANKTTSGLSNADVVLGIPAGGSTSDRVEEVSLGGSQILLVVDESNKAVFMPQAQSSAEAKGAENLNRFVYAFENGACNFGRTLTYEEIFPGLGSSDPKTFWVKTTGPLDAGSQNSSEAASGSTSVTKYVFTNPPSEKLEGKKATFCVRFQSLASSVTATTSAAPTTPSRATTPATTLASASPDAPSKLPENGEHTQAGSNTEAVDVESQPQKGEKPSQDSLQALKMKELAAAARAAQAKQKKENYEGSVNFLEIAGNKSTVRRLSGTYISKASGEGETPAGHYLTVIIHSSASHVALHTLSVIAVLTSSLLAILRTALF